MIARREHWRPLRFAALVSVLWPVAASAFAADVTVTRIDGTTITGEASRLTPKIVVRAVGGDEEITWTDALSVRFGGTDVLSESERPPLWFVMADGSSFAASLTTAEPSALRVTPAIGEPLTFEISALRSIEPSHARGESGTRLAQLRQAEPPEADDIILVAKDDDVLELRGACEALTATDVRFTWNGRSLTLPWERVAGLLLAHPVTPPGPHSVRLRAGDVLVGEVVASDSEQLDIQSALLGCVRIPIAVIARIDCRGGRLIYLSELEHARYEFEPMFAKRWPYTIDETLTRQPIRLNGRQFARGICMHSHATLSYRLAGGYERFLAEVGIVDEMDARGSVAVRVVGDGRQLWEAEHVRGGQPPRTCNVDVTGVKELSLEVDFGDDLDLSDQVAWAEARLIRAERR